MRAVAIDVLRRFLPGARGVLERCADSLRKQLRLYPLPLARRDALNATRFFVGPLLVRREHAFIDLEIKLVLSWEQTRAYRGSKLYYKSEPQQSYDESACIFFWVHRNNETERLRLVLPEAARTTGWIKLRLDALPLAAGFAEVSSCRLAEAGGPHEALDQAAVLHAMKLRTDQEVVTSIAMGRQVLEHYPQALSMEIQPQCNLTCAHCPTHGKPEAHAQSNCMEEMSLELLAKVAHEVFPHVDCVNLVGRGEPLLASDALWDSLIDHLKAYGVKLVAVTNGTLVRRRITPEILPMIETLSISIDGATAQTFAKNRGGASLTRVMDAVAYFHDLRKRACLPRRPKLSISWTIKKNNVAELPSFVRHMAQFEPDKFFFRYMVLCEELELDQDLLDDPEAANACLIDAYTYLEQLGVEVIRPPLFDLPPRCSDEKLHAPLVNAPPEPPDSSSVRRCPHMFAEGAMLANGAIMSCQAYFAESVGDLNVAPDFMSLWSGERMQSLRSGVSGDAEWSQCRECWISQMRCFAPDMLRAQKNASTTTAQLTENTRKAWDLRHCSRR